MFQQNRDFILASGSPRRKQYLERYHLRFDIITADIDESLIPGEKPAAYARRLSREKGMRVAGRGGGNEVVIAADTIVILEDRILGKPEGRADVLPMLIQLNGKEHQVMTSFFVFDKKTGEQIHGEVTTTVIFDHLPLAQLSVYAATEEPLDKAGAYSIQGIGTFLVKSINGSYNNVVGLPIEVLLQVLLENGYIGLMPD